MNDVVSTERGFGPYLLMAGLLSLACGVLSFVLLSGGGHLFKLSPLVAEVQVEAMAMPAAFRLDAEEIATDLSERLQRRATEDFALRTLLGSNGQQQVSEIVIPRLLNAGVIRRMIQEIPSLEAVTAVSSYKSYIALQVNNTGDIPLTDVAFSAPGAVRAEKSDGSDLPIVTPDRDVDVVNLGNLEPGGEVNVRIWFENLPEDILLQRDNFLLAARNVRSGQINFRGTGREWFGADLEVTPWGRWLVGAVVLSLGLGGFISLLFSAQAWLAARRRTLSKAETSRA